jgi:hypothetical protein
MSRRSILPPSYWSREQPSSLNACVTKSQLARTGNALIDSRLCAIVAITPEKRRRHRESPRTPVRREGTKFQSPCRHFRSNICRVELSRFPRSQDRELRHPASSPEWAHDFPIAQGKAGLFFLQATCTISEDSRCNQHPRQIASPFLWPLLGLDCCSA